MLVLLSNLNLVTRVEIPVSKTVQKTLVQGHWVKWDGSAKLAADTTGGAQVWTECSRAAEKLFESGTAVADCGEPRFTPDALSQGDSNGQLTVLYGKYRALTNCFAGNPSIGSYLSLDADGNLAATTAVSGIDSQDAIAVCTKVKHQYTHIGSDYEVIEYVTL